MSSEPNTTTAADSVVTFNEIMYHPSSDDASLEWIELYNQMSLDMDISGWRIEGGIEFQFPTNSVFPAGRYLVISSNPDRLRAATGLTNIYGPFTSRLSSSGEELRLRNQSGRLLDEMSYSDEDPWPVGADGSGASLGKRDRFQASSPAANWRASAEPGGTPGRENFPENAAAEPAEITLLRNDAASRWFVPADDSGGEMWLATNFDDSAWAAGTASVGYDLGTTGPVELSNVALGKTVIAGSGAYSNNPFNVPDAAGDFVAQNVTDGSTSDVFGQNYWLGRQGRINEHFTLDLGRVVQIHEIHLRNTHNAHHNDRGTADFEIWASQSIDSVKQLVSPARILSGRLTDVMGIDPIPLDIFAQTNGLVVTNARYLRYVALTANNSGNNVGLNEIEVHGPAISGPDRAYRFDGNFEDSSGSALHGQNSGAQFSTNVPPVRTSGQSALFDGASQVTIPDPVNPPAYTVSMWVNVETVQSSSIILRTDSAGPKSAWSHQLRINGSGRFEHYVFAGTGRSIAATNTIVPGTWYHLALVAASDGAIRIFVNGAQSGGATTISQLWAGGNQWRLGSDAGNAQNFFHGRLDDLAIWHSELDAGSIATLAAGRSPSQLGGLRRFFTTDLEEALHQKNNSVRLRIPFEIPTATLYESLALRVRYADGFVAFLNGAEIARRNAPTGLAWNAAATVDRDAAQAINFESIDLGGHAAKFVPGRNILAVQAMNHSAADESLLFSVELVAAPVAVGLVTNVAFSEIAAAGSTQFFVEVANSSASPASLGGCTLVSSAGGTYRFPSNSLAPGSFLLLSRSNLNFSIQDGDRLFLLGRGGDLIDAVEIHNRGRGRMNPSADARWFYTSVDTPAETNAFSFRGEIVINEVMYHHRPFFRTKDTPYTPNEEQWIELYNRSAVPVDLTGWRLDGEAVYFFLPETIMAPDSYLVVARDAGAMRAKYPAVTVLGNFQGRLSHHSGSIILRDPAGNPADEIRYFNSHPWPGHANGGGSSLELRDPRSDNAVPEAWAASSEGARSAWRRYSYRAAAVRPVYSPSIFNFHEFRMGLLDEGEVLVDNVTVTELPVGAPARQLLQNSTFANGTQSWRLLGNHSHSSVEPREGNSGDSVLRLVATGNTSYLDNRLETTLKAGGTIVPVVTGREYEISFDAKWIAGSPQLRTELYYNKIAATTILDLPAESGTPGRRNSIYVPNAGPTYTGLHHLPVIPAANEPVQLNITANDPDGIAEMRAFYSVNGGSWRNVLMGETARSIYAAIIPAQANGAVIQFYVQGTDARGTVSAYPQRGAVSRALIKIDSTRTVAGKQTFRTIMTPADSVLLHSAINMMSDDLLGCTVVHHEREVFYDARIRLHGSMFSRNQPNLTGMTLKFPVDHLFRGSRESVIVRRRGLVETLTKHILNAAGGLPGNYDDVVHLISHRTDNAGTARMNLANYDDTYVESQFEGDDDGTVFKLEGIREYQTTQNGSPEGLKLSQPIGWIQTFDITNLGDDPEQYRWGIMIQSDRKRDDYSRIVAMGKAFSLSGAALRQAAEATIDIDEWARLFALQSLLGIADVYSVEHPHNFAFYVRPSDGRVVGLQNDWEFAFGRAATDSIYGSKNVYKILRLPGVQRIFQGHMLDLIDSVGTSAYMTPWARHYSTVMGESYNNIPNYIATRAASARRQLAARIPFEITSNGGADFSVSTPAVTLEGRGWIDAYRISRNGQTTPLRVSWIDDQRWTATVPLAPGTNNIRLVAFNYRGLEVGADTINITTTADFPERDYLRITELMYHPALPSTLEVSAGFTDENDFEFVELMNRGPVELSLSGVRFTAGITYDFSTAAITNLSPGGRVLVVKNRNAFEIRYGTNLPVAGEFDGSLSNGGELIRLVDAQGRIIHEFTYGDSGEWPEAADGGGRSLQVRDFDGDYNDPSNWQVSSAIGGDPGSAGTTPPLIGAIIVAGGQVQLSFHCAPDTTYEVFVTDDVRSGSWVQLKLIPPQSLPRTEFVSDPVQGITRFYRVRSF